MWELQGEAHQDDPQQAAVAELPEVKSILLLMIGREGEREVEEAFCARDFCGSASVASVRMLPRL